MRKLEVDDSARTTGRPPRMDPRTVAIFNHAVGLQRDALVRAADWLENLPVSEDVRDQIYIKLCSVTGQIIDRLVIPEELGWS